MYDKIMQERLRKARKDSGYTQTQIEDILGIKQCVLSQYENGKTQPDIETLGKLIDLYEVPAQWILGTKK